MERREKKGVRREERGQRRKEDRDESVHMRNDDFRHMTLHTHYTYEYTHTGSTRQSRLSSVILRLSSLISVLPILSGMATCDHVCPTVATPLLLARCWSLFSLSRAPLTPLMWWEGGRKGGREGRGGRMKETLIDIHTQPYVA